MRSNKIAPETQHTLTPTENINPAIEVLANEESQVSDGMSSSEKLAGLPTPDSSAVIIPSGMEEGVERVTFAKFGVNWPWLKFESPELGDLYYEMRRARTRDLVRRASWLQALGTGNNIIELLTPISIYITGQVIIVAVMWLRERVLRQIFAYERAFEQKVGLPLLHITKIAKLEDITVAIYEGRLLDENVVAQDKVYIKKRGELKTLCQRPPNLKFTRSDLESEYQSAIYPKLFDFQVWILAWNGIIGVGHVYLDIVTFCAEDLVVLSYSLSLLIIVIVTSSCAGQDEMLERRLFLLKRVLGPI
ncbi:hypothetical protein HDU76_000580 [Blyttiomyces sp. JEL0837]|nr:hypothetical protein HDU76_000580 [Blyttiomyces sp. JEL0837]